MTRAAILALLALLLAPAAARAVVRPDAPALAVAPDPAWVAVAERLALDYAARAGWTDACAGRTIRIDVYRDLDVVHGRPVVAYADLGGACSMAVEGRQLANPAVFCDTYVHERLHLVRGDAWHDPEPGHPLFTDVLPYAPCRAAWRPRLTRTEAAASVRARLGNGWRIAVVGDASGDAAEAVMLVRATRRRARRARVRRLEFEVVRERAGAPVTVARII